MAYTTINKSSDFFNTKLYTGNGSTNAITGVGFQPDWTWIKDRTNAYGHDIYDVIRGVTNRIQSNSADGESTGVEGLKSFDSDGFTLGSYIGDNTNNSNYASWNWKANGAGSTNYDGSINSTVSANTVSGFSIVKYTGTGSSGTIGHGLGVTPKIVIYKNLVNTSENFYVYSSEVGATKYLQLNTTGASTTSSGYFNNTAPTSSVLNVGTANGTNQNTNSIIAYCFAEKTGYSKFGSYTGNGNNDGTFVYLGFKPAFFLIKRTDSSESWIMTDSKRGYPQSWKYLLADTSNSEDPGGIPYDFLSNGVKFRGGTQNGSGATFIYMAFGQSLVGSNNVPCTAR